MKSRMSIKVAEPRIYKTMAVADNQMRIQLKKYI